MDQKLEVIKGSRAKRLANEIDGLANEIQSGYYKQYTSPFPHFVTEHGKFGNNRVFIGHFESIDGNDITLVSPVFGYMYTRDDRTVRDDESTKHINVHYRLLGRNCNGSIIQGSFKRPEDHTIGLGDCCSTAAADIDRSVGVEDLPDYGAITDLVERGLIFELNYFLDHFDFDE